eukprot:365603-Chlamydomonas_euryale.AAC.19
MLPCMHAAPNRAGMAVYNRFAAYWLPWMKSLHDVVVAHGTMLRELNLEVRCGLPPSMVLWAGLLSSMVLWVGLLLSMVLWAGLLSSMCVVRHRGSSGGGSARPKVVR